MKRLLLPAVISFLVISGCKPKSKNGDDKADSQSPLASVANYAKIIGSYVGDFGTNKITLLITKSVNDTIEGRSVVGGNDRPFAGVVKFEGGKYNVNAKEPGNDQYDGVFNFSIDEKQPDVVTGNWKPNTANAHLGPKDFSLKRRSFNYLVDVGQYPIASKQLLKEDDVSNMSAYDLATMRNEIFARHGYCFRKKDLREMFEDKDWYIPNTVDVKKDLTEIEKKNIALIKRYEKYAEEYGDDYGR
ncbi:MAG TPA: YARHG domain-containing protein [Ferruginibacter sp.]|nr:YARHG domain-containing protein [Ferruginibacter sp.]